MKFSSEPVSSEVVLSNYLRQDYTVGKFSTSADYHTVGEQPYFAPLGALLV